MTTRPDSSNEEGTYTLFNGAELPKFRSVNEFLLDGSRYEAPPVNDLDRWNNRILSNMLYYQTNYFAVFFGLLALFSFYGGQDFCLGVFAIALVSATALFSVSPNPQFHQVRRDHPLITLGAIVVSFYLFITFLASVLYVLICVLVPLLCVLLHASCRLRNFANKARLLAERVGLKKTVMGQLLEAIGVSVKE